MTLWPPVNIWSGCDDPLGAALTNPTTWSRRKGRIDRDYAVEYAGIRYPDAEAAYKAHQRAPGDEAAMLPVLVAKLHQHPRLVAWIEARGGLAWLQTCSHHVGARTARGRHWEGVGAQSPFIRALCQAYAQLQP